MNLCVTLLLFMNWKNYEQLFLTKNAPVLRPYQEAAVVAVRSAYKEGYRSVLLVLATGCGKTVIFSNIANRVVVRQQRVLVLAHRTELLTQAQAKLRDVGLYSELEQGVSRSDAAPVVLASVQTLKGKRLASFARDTFTLIIIDEAHHAAAETYRTIIKHFRTARVLGVTATPERADGVDLMRLFDKVAYRYDMLKAMRAGHLAPMRSTILDMPTIDLSKVALKGSDFDPVELAKLLNEERALRGMADQILTTSVGRKTMIFTVDVKNAYAMAAVLNQLKPKSALAVDGSSPTETRAAALAAFRANKFTYLINCALFTEGFDEPSLGCVVIARPTKSRVLHTQMLGRGARLALDKTECLSVDFTSSKSRTITAPDSLAGFELDPADLARVAASPLYLHQALEYLAPS